MLKSRFILLLAFFLIFANKPLMAAEEKGSNEPKMLSGMSVVGNDEAPKSLFIVPWKSSEIGFETNLNRGLMDESLRPVDKEVFIREINFYEIRHAN